MNNINVLFFFFFPFSSSFIIPLLLFFPTPNTVYCIIVHSNVPYAFVQLYFTKKYEKTVTEYLNN